MGGIMPHRLANLELSQLLSSPVKSNDGQILGHINDIILNAQNGRIEYVKLSLETNEYVAAQFVAIPWSQFKLVNIEVDVELNISLKALKICATSAR